MFDFGRNKDKSLAWAEENDPGYIQWCVQSKIHDVRPMLRDALVAHGVELPVALPAAALQGEVDLASNGRHRDQQMAPGGPIPVCGEMPHQANSA